MEFKTLEKIDQTLNLGSSLLNGVNVSALVDKISVEESVGFVRDNVFSVIQDQPKVIAGTIITLLLAQYGLRKVKKRFRDRDLNDHISISQTIMHQNDVYIRNQGRPQKIEEYFNNKAVESIVTRFIKKMDKVVSPGMLRKFIKGGGSPESVILDFDGYNYEIAAKFLRDVRSDIVDPSGVSETVWGGFIYEPQFKSKESKDNKSFKMTRLMEFREEEILAMILFCEHKSREGIPAEEVLRQLGYPASNTKRVSPENSELVNEYIKGLDKFREVLV